MSKIAFVGSLLVIGVLAVYNVYTSFVSTKLRSEAQAQTTTTDWSQLQNDSSRTGRTTVSVQASRYRLRWLWVGPTRTVRNKLSNSAWNGPIINPGDVVNTKLKQLTPPDPLPTTVPFTLNWAVQPVTGDNKLFVGDMEGSVYAISMDDGSTLWTAENRGGTLTAGAYSNNTVIFGSIDGYVRGYNSANGTLKFEVATKGSISGAPAISGSRVYIADQMGYVYAINITDGTVAWTSPFLGGPIAGGIALDANSLYVGAENMMFYSLNISDGTIRHSKKVSGQTFYTTWPVVYNGLVFIEAAAIPTIGSEYIAEDVMAAATSIDDEQNRILSFLSGQGGYSNASSDWKHLTILRTSDFSEPFSAPVLPFEGLGKPPYPPVVDNQGRVLTYFKTKYPRLTWYGIDCDKTTGSTWTFGTRYCADISAIDQTTGRRIPIDNGKLGGIWWWDTDNLYAPSVAGNLLLLHHTYHRGLYAINLTTSNGQWIKTVHRNADGVVTQADITYLQDQTTEGFTIRTQQQHFSDRNAAIAANGKLFTVEQWGIAAIEPNQ